MCAFIIRPAVVAALAQNIHFLPAVLADVSNPDLASDAIDAEAPGMAKANGEKLAAQGGLIDRGTVKIGHAKERIVGWDTIERVAAAISWDSGMGGGFDAAGSLIHIEP